MSTSTMATQQTAPQYDAEQQTALLQQFLLDYPTFQTTQLLDQWRQTDYGRLDTNHQIYLDYTGGGLYAESQLDAHMAILRTRVLGNPHSANPTSMAMTDLVEGTRAAILRYFNASPDEYIVVFTQNASGALKLAGEAYPFGEGSQYLLTYDNHNSVNGIREFARDKGAAFTYVPLTSPELRIDEDRLADLLAAADTTKPNLFAFPAQSNFSGVKHPLRLVSLAQEQGWDVCLDAAAFVPTNQLDLSQVKPEFVAMSFYKMFGYPTGLGALFIRKSVLGKLHRPWFAGGTVNFVSAQAESHILSKNEAAFEDGTVNYLNIPAIKIGLEHLQKVGISLIGERVNCLTGWLIDQLMQLKHDNGRPMIRLYGPANTHMRGGTVTLNFYDPDGRMLDFRRIEELANEKGISLRTGCFCNPGAGEIAEGLTRVDMLAGFAEGDNLNMPRFLQVIETRSNKSMGAIRISVGLATNFDDVYRFMAFAASFRNKTNLNIGKVTFDIESCRVIRDGS